jgi:hypothetical protein
MTWNWQDFGALSIVSIAVVYVAYSVYRRLRRREVGACGSGCFGCTQPEPEANELVTSIGTSASIRKQVPRGE